jgi:hypothetical protein
MKLAEIVRKIRTLPENLTFNEAAKRIGLNYQSARRHLIAFGYPHSDGRKYSQSGKRRFDPDLADWSQSNIEIASQFGVTRERVRLVRKQLNKPFVESRGCKPKEANATTVRVSKRNISNRLTNGRAMRSAHPDNRGSLAANRNSRPTPASRSGRKPARSKAGSRAP